MGTHSGVSAYCVCNISERQTLITASSSSQMLSADSTIPAMLGIRRRSKMSDEQLTSSNTIQVNGIDHVSTVRDEVLMLLVDMAMFFLPVSFRPMTALAHCHHP